MTGLPRRPSRPAAQILREVEALLARYPDLHPDERARLLPMFRSLSLLDKAVIMADAQMSERLDDFYRDHCHELSAPYARIGFVLAAAIVIGIIFSNGLSP